jgi:hypothetical protein
MSIAEFSDAFKNRIFTQYSELSRAKKETAINMQDTTKLRKIYESAGSGASSIFTSNGIQNVMASVVSSIEDSKLAEYAESLLNNINFNNFSNYVQEQVSASKAGVYTDLGNNAFKLSNLPQVSLRKYFLNYISIIIELDDHPSGHKLIDYLTVHLQSGHLAGVFSLKLVSALGLKAEFTGNTYRDFTISSSTGISKTEQTLEVILKGLLDADFLTSNIVDRQEIFTTATKSVLSNNPHLEVEIQFKKDNEAAGALLQQAGSALNKVLARLTSSGLNNKDADDAFKKFAETLKPLVKVLNDRVQDLQSTKQISDELASSILNNTMALNILAETLVNVKGSPSLVESIVQQIAEALANKPRSSPIITTFSQTSSTKNKDPISSVINTALKGFVQEVAKTLNSKSAKVKVNEGKLRTNTGQFYSLLSLQSLLNNMLPQQIRKNMGSGGSRNVLNNRTGRFSESVHVDRMTTSRDGMISAFYTYMKYPYATFSEGGAQSSPTSRDPKLLIAKSIREIAATKVANRMRAVLS